MANNGYNSNGDPVYSGTGAPASGADLSEATAYAGARGNNLIGTTTERNAFAYAKPGLEWFDTTLGAKFIYIGTSWVLLSVPGDLQMYYRDVSRDNVANGTTLTTIPFGTSALARLITLRVSGTTGATAHSTQGSGIAMSPTNCTISRTGVSFDETIDVINATKWYSYSLERIVSIAAGANASIAINTVQVGGDPTYFRVTAVGNVFYAGQY